LIDGGVKNENIFEPEICTCCNPNLLFSHRASKGRRGNLGAFLGIKKSSDRT
ncbi:MAG: laccase domain-containing protein, partial [Lachnospiraceae bacterium]|nr:laccase domain-containing protein [Candidatus Equihabitans merdae]